jgi:hypothetical protein
MSTEGQDYNYAIRSDIMPHLAEQIGLNALPMKDPNFNFFGAAFAAFRGTNLRGAAKYDAARDVIRMILTPTSKGIAPIYRYAGWYQKQANQAQTPHTFDAFVQMAVYQRVHPVLTTLGRKKRKPGISIGREEGEGGITEDSLEDVKAPRAEEIYQRQEERERRDEALSSVPSRLLTDERHGHRYLAMWELMKEDYKMPLWKLAEELNKEGVTSPSGGQWDTGSTHRVRNIILRIVRDFLEQKGIDWESISESRKGFSYGAVS